MDESWSWCFFVTPSELMSPAEVMTSSLKVMQMWEKEKENEVFVTERYEDLEGLDERREKAQECSHRYRQRMTEACAK